MELNLFSKKEYTELDYLIHKRIMFLISPEVKKRKSIQKDVKNEIELLNKIRQKANNLKFEMSALSELNTDIFSEDFEEV